MAEADHYTTKRRCQGAKGEADVMIYTIYVVISTILRIRRWIFFGNMPTNVNTTYPRFKNI